MEVALSDVTVRAAQEEVLAEVSLRCRAGESTGIVGVSGAGKTTVLHCLGLLVSPDSGSVLVAGESTTNWTDRKRRAFWREEAAFVFQDYGLIEDEDVAYNVGLGLRGRRQVIEQRVVRALADVGLGDRAAELVSRLSGGEKQRVGLARAVAKDAAYVFADEPTASLDAGNRLMVIRLLRQRAESGTVVVVATHDEQVMGACDALHRLSPPAGDPLDPAGGSIAVSTSA